MIHALPGMGADERMFPTPWDTLTGFTACNWKSWSGEKTLVAMADSICKAASINDGDSLVGASLGGMVACEITKIRKIKTLFLVGSATHKDEINSLIKILQPLAPIAPIEWLRISAGKIPHELFQMFTDANPSFIRMMCSAIFEWQGLANPNTQVHRIHGKHDLVIPPPKKLELALNGGHLISLTHANECVDYIRSQLSK